ncbi:MAG: cytochrome c [Gemmatimonadetes bacterium]|nr:cytochrome c [Gemmatimonadota bacterium]
MKVIHTSRISNILTAALLASACGQDADRSGGGQPGGDAPAVANESTAPPGGGKVYTETQAARGQTAYQNHCAFCHLDDLSGFRGLPLTGPEFIARWNEPGVTLENFLSFVTSAMPQEEPGTLRPQEYLDVVAYILQANGYPAGDRELTAEPSVLRAIRIEPQE